jgi:hypothetical protein
MKRSLPSLCALGAFAIGLVVGSLWGLACEVATVARDACTWTIKAIASTFADPAPLAEPTDDKPARRWLQAKAFMRPC